MAIQLLGAIGVIPIFTIGAVVAVTVLMLAAVFIGHNGTGLDDETSGQRPGPAAVNPRHEGVGSGFDGGF